MSSSKLNRVSFLRHFKLVAHGFGLALLVFALGNPVTYAADKGSVKGARIPVILDTDIGGDIDDTWALGLLLKSPELDLKLVVGDK